MPATSWSADDLALLSELTAEGMSAEAIAARMHRTRGSVWTALSRHHLSMSGQPVSVRERVLALAAQGWTVSRISRQHGLNLTAIRRLLAVEGVTPARVRPRPTGRLDQGAAA